MTTNIPELLQYTGLRLYTEGIDGVEIHDAGKVVAVKKNKPAAHAYVEGAAYMKRKLEASKHE